MSLLQLDGLRAIVTGAASGIGAATAASLRSEGAHVVGLDINADDRNSGSILECDVSNERSVEGAVAQAVAALGGLDILVNNAGIGAAGDVTMNPIDEWQRVFDVNVFGVVRMSAACIPELRVSNHAVIVNLASIVSWTGLVNRACYGASKGAVYALTLAMAADHAHEGIRVNCVCPGTIDTPWVGRILESAADPESARASLIARQPIGRLGTAEEVAAAICYLASPSAGYTTGTALQIDGGTHSFVVPGGLAGGTR
jgi:2-keto-3-deoxy-L-fuconate dehydrogenase